ncbi:MAG: hypothetical protein LBV26_07530, partial [Bacteroidales bacterium]|nr:hypothetical protein [Bacteroidales bacterium]
MKKNCLLFFILLFQVRLIAQTTIIVDPDNSGGTNTYSSLREAFDYIKNAASLGDVFLQIAGSTTEPATATLSASGSYTSVTIYPASAGLSIRGNAATGGPLIKLDGAANVIFDGRVNMVGSEPNLTITHENTAQPAITVAQSSDITVHYCNIQGAATAITTGILAFSTPAGNRNITISNNYFTGNSAGRPANGIYALGTAAETNSNFIISNNRFYDLL